MNEFWEPILHTIIHRLNFRGNTELAAKLVDCEIEAHITDSWNGVDYWEVQLKPPLAYFDKLTEMKQEILDVLSSVLQGRDDECVSLNICHPIVETHNGWRDEIRFEIMGAKINNQGAIINHAPYQYNGLRFRSKSEIAIAKAFDRREVLYFPLPIAALKGIKKEPDFLVKIPSGKWGILEVQGESFHPPTRADQDHERARFFMHFGIPVYFFSATYCYNHANDVVDEFINLVEKS